MSRRRSAPPPAPPVDESGEISRLHARVGWWALLLFVTLGVALETLSGFKVGLYLEVANSTRRLMWTLAHAHGTLLSVLNIVFGLTLAQAPRWTAPGRRLASRCLRGALVLMPLGFFLGGVRVHGGDPGLGILLVPPGALLLIVGVGLTARALTTAGRTLGVLALAATASTSACAPRAIEGFPPQAYYRTGSPFTDISDDLERVVPAVVRIQMRATYDVYLFEERDAPSDAELARGADALERAARVETSTTGRAASAILVGANGRRGTLLATEHSIILPDTTVAYFPADSSGAPRRLERVAIKRRQVDTAVGPGYVEPFVVLAEDPRRDLVILGVDVPEDVGPLSLEPLPAAAGRPGRLAWGALVFVVGYPAGYQMVTRGIVSRPAEVGSADEFLIDALVNEGSSGAAVLAIRGDTEELEWVGVTRAAATRNEMRLLPRLGQADADGAGAVDEPYDGPTYLSRVQEIRYGITLTIPVTVIRDFLGEHRGRLADAGYVTGRP